MPIRCPVCRADNTVPSNCRRCKADLSLLWGLEAQRTGHLAGAREAVDRGAFDEAIDEIDRAAEIRRGTDLHRLRAAVYLLAGDFESALALHDAAVGTAEAV